MLLNHLPAPLSNALLKARAPFVYARLLSKSEIDLRKYIHPYKTIRELEAKCNRLNTSFAAQIAQELSDLPQFKSNECWNCKHLCAIEYRNGAVAVGCGAGLTDEQAKEEVLRVGRQIKGLTGFRTMKEYPKRLEAAGQPDCVATLRDMRYRQEKSSIPSRCEQIRPLHQEQD